MFKRNCSRFLHFQFKYYLIFCALYFLICCSIFKDRCASDIALASICGGLSFYHISDSLSIPFPKLFSLTTLFHQLVPFCAPCYYITQILICQHFFQYFLKNFQSFFASPTYSIPCQISHNIFHPKHNTLLKKTVFRDTINP